jgi:hypothetical protein
MSIKDGGPAFPAPDFAIASAMGQKPDDTLLMRLADLRGMSVRTWLIGQALSGSAVYVSKELGHISDMGVKFVTIAACKIADAALAEINKGSV